MPELRFKSSYRGESEYTLHGQRYAIRFFAADDGYYNGNYYHEGIEPLVGCLYHCGGGTYHDFPSPEALELARQSYPQVIGARWLPGFTGIEYQEPPPDLVKTKWGYVMPLWYAILCEHSADLFNHHERLQVA